eukprot:scaffold7.g3626.t1
MDAGEGARQAELAAANGVPRMQPGRKVIIYTPARTAGQQGISQTAAGGGPAWKVQFENQAKWINPLMGWTSTADALENEAAIAFAEKNGWSFEVEEPHLRSRARPRRYLGYGDNFSVKRKGLPQGGLRSELAGGKK